jgi:hypothetical protein
MAALRRRIDEAENCIRSRTDIAVDVPVGWNSPCQIIVVGRYKGGDYIQTFTVQSGDLGQIVDLLKDMVRYGVVRHVDAAPHVRGFFPFGQQRDKGRR